MVYVQIMKLHGRVKRIFDWLEKQVGDRRERRRVDRLLNEQGFVVFCPECKKILNDDNEPEIASDASFTYTCECGVKTTFAFGFYSSPIIKVEA
jgi:lysyl-tRNA synthetase class I